MDIIPILASISLGFYLMATSYRHALVFKSNTQIVLVNLIFAIVSMLMYFLGYKLGLATIVTITFNPAIISIILFLFLAVRMYFSIAKGKLSEMIVDLNKFKKVFPLSLSLSFESFLAALSVSYMFANIYRSMLYTIIFILLFLFVGVYAGKQSSRLASIKILYVLSSLFYLINGVICIFITLFSI
jgi:putative Mn2+ efflux pump MntP